MNGTGMHRILMTGLCVLGLTGAPAWAATNGNFSLGIGGEYTTGEYGSGQTTDIWYFPVTFKYETERNSVSLTMPFVVVDGPGNVTPGGFGGMSNGIRAGSGSGSSHSEAGLGDLELKATFNLVLEDRFGPRLDLTGIAKAGTADAQDNLGTGEDDIGVQMDLERHYGSNNVFGSVGYRFLGDPPGVNFDNVLYGTLGTEFGFGDAASLGVALDAQQAPLPSASSALTLTLFMASRVDAKTKLTGYVLHGLRDGSPDWGVGVRLKITQ